MLLEGVRRGPVERDVVAPVEHVVVREEGAGLGDVLGDERVGRVELGLGAAEEAHRSPPSAVSSLSAASPSALQIAVTTASSVSTVSRA